MGEGVDVKGPRRPRNEANGEQIFESPGIRTLVDPAWRPVAVDGRLYERIVERLENLIAAKGLKSGDRLPSEREMASLLRVSRPSLREAVRTLVGRGRLAVLHGKGIFLSQPATVGAHLAEVATRQIGLRELFAMREVLEVPAAGWAAEAASPEQLDLLTKAFETLDRAASKRNPDYDLVQALDATFHLRIAEAAGNRFMLRTISVLQEMLAAGMSTTLSIPGRLAQSRQHHRQICEAIVQGKRSSARHAMRVHIRSAANAALKRLDDEGGSVAAHTVAGSLPQTGQPGSRQVSARSRSGVLPKPGVLGGTVADGS